MKRRNFLRTGGAMLAGGAAFGATFLRERQARAFGEVPSGSEAAMLPEELRVDSVLEIFLAGGVSQYESFYCVPEHGASDSTHWHLYLDSGDVEAAVDACGFTGDLLQPFAKDDEGQLVHLGPFVAPLRQRLDVMERLRILTVSHDVEPHEAAAPLALTGRSVGHPSAAGLGAHVQRYCLERSDDPGRAPFSYVLVGSSLQAMDNVRNAAATGQHPGTCRPLSMKVDAAADLLALLSRSTVGAARSDYDALMQVSIDRYAQRLRWNGAGDPLRSHRFEELVTANANIANADAIQKVIGAEPMPALPGDACGIHTPVDSTRMSLQLAAHLITHPEAPAKYVCVVDGGLPPGNKAGGYDTHENNSLTQASNLFSVLGSLMEIINAPGENDPKKLELDRTLIVLNTEFGRTPYGQGVSGRNHWPYGYPVALLGGPISAERSGVFGACGPDARATRALSPTQLRAGALIALGIWPFAHESFNVGDVAGTVSESGAVSDVALNVLGYS